MLAIEMTDEALALTTETESFSARISEYLRWPRAIQRICFSTIFIIRLSERGWLLKAIVVRGNRWLWRCRRGDLGRRGFLCQRNAIDFLILMIHKLKKNDHEQKGGHELHIQEQGKSQGPSLPHDLEREDRSDDSDRPLRRASLSPPPRPTFSSQYFQRRWRWTVREGDVVRLGRHDRRISEVGAAVSAWDSTVQRDGRCSRLQQRLGACGAQFTFAPCVAVCRDSRWGRCYESYGEDTEIVRKMTTIVTGLQGQPPQGQPRDYPFVAGREFALSWLPTLAGMGGIYTDHFLTTQVLKEKLGFKVRIICCRSDKPSGIGRNPIARIDDAVERILRVKFVAGLFEYPLTDRSLLDTVGCKNGMDSNKPFLPLKRNAERILAAGTHADNLGYQCGWWTATWMGDSGRITICTNILEAIKAAVERTQSWYMSNDHQQTLLQAKISILPL
ncbi:glycosyl hydrolase family protein [Actinidia rufa]|uniref:Glycosyl hydrolase family protein n=1 Tax=Actinidia rufa TaxID=165716 RepID=A0A7J0DPB2_9ERIC|nr:glycosyl hydrolase family protein [Actinidia rufa]